MKKLLLFLIAALFTIGINSQPSFGQVTSLTGTGDSLTIELSGAPATTNPTYTLFYRTTQGQGTGSKIGRSNGTTPVTMLAGVANGTAIVDNVMVHNADTASVTVIVKKISAAVTYQIEKVVLPSASTLMISKEQGIRVTDTNGQILNTLSSGLMSNSIGASTAGAGTNSGNAGVLPAGTATTYPTTLADDTVGVRVHANDKVTGRVLFIGNGVSNKILKVYAPTGGIINGAAADAAFSSVSGKGVIIQCLDATGNTWLAW